MKNNDENKNDRRDFLKKSGGAVLGLAALTFGMSLKEALAQAREARKPLLTEKSLNDLLTSEKFRKEMPSAAENVQKYVREKFYLTPQQEKNLDRISENEIRKIGAALRNSKENDIKVLAKFAPPVNVQMPPIEINLTFNINC